MDCIQIGGMQLGRNKTGLRIGTKEIYIAAIIILYSFKALIVVTWTFCYIIFFSVCVYIYKVLYNKNK